MSGSFFLIIFPPQFSQVNRQNPSEGVKLNVFVVEGLASLNFVLTNSA